MKSHSAAGRGKFTQPLLRLTRVRSLEGIKLKSINKTALLVNEEVIEVDKKLQEMSDELAIELRKSSWMKRENG